uniref:Uncharacterized protein n=1 Tax=viral metagenome TaxID=1070528 RepID=A0A6C0KEA9_9ZZZZ
MTEACEKYHTLSDKWVLWAHLPHDTNWSLSSYKKILKFTTIEELITLYDSMSETLVKNCMLFLMKHNINPIWEDKQNRNGGCFSFKSSNKNVYIAWKNLSFYLVGNTLTENDNLMKNITGITISPKKSFCIIKIWVNCCEFQNPTILERVKSLNFQGCLFKRHIAKN